ncbi:MAG: DUF4214 domain-containing protein [Clostridiales bacterium]|nr:DUF4214 domain-containing protein [Clostridiales bacterium]
MRYIKSIAVSIAAALLLAFMTSVFVPAFANKVNAATDVIEVDSEYALKSAVESSVNKGRTVKLKKNIISTNTITIKTSITLDFEELVLQLVSGKKLIIETQDENDTVTLTGQGHIYASVESNMVEVKKGKLIVESGYIQNTHDKGSCFNSTSNIMIIGTAFKSKSKLGKDIVIPFSEVEEHYSSYDDTYTYEIYSFSDFSTLKIGDKYVTRDNYNDVLGNGIFCYDLWTKTLNVNGDYDYGIAKDLIISYVDGLTIKFNNHSELTGRIKLGGDTTITGNNSLVLSASDTSAAITLSESADLTIKEVSMLIMSGVAIKGDGQGKLIIDDSEIVGKSKGCFSESLSNIEMENCEIVRPQMAEIKDGCVYHSGGTTPANDVLISSYNSGNSVTYTWSDDYSECTASIKYKFNAVNNKTETVKTTSTVKIAATTNEKGTTTYTATFSNKAFKTQTKDVQDIPVLQPNPITDPIPDPPTQVPSTPEPSNTNPSDPSTSTGGSFGEFVERLYNDALNRPSEEEGKAYWCEHVGNGDLTGAQCAKEFLLSEEFKNRNLSDEDFLKVLYKTFFDRDAVGDPEGFNFWLNSLKTEGRDKVVEGFINSTEWCNICASFGVKSGATSAKATIASANATAFAKRLYTECLGREAEEGGLKFWSLGLTNLELTGAQAAHEFFFSEEFNGHNFDNKELITRMYKTFMGRDPEDDGMNYWLKEMENGMTKEQIFNEFVKSKEFTEICQKYAIDRG